MTVSEKLRTCLLKGSMLLFLCCLLLFPGPALTGAKNGLLLWFNQVLPSLLPFLILSTLLLSTGVSDSLATGLAPVLSPIFRCSPSGCYAIVIGFLAGLPVGAKTIASLTADGRITKKEGQYLLPLCNNPSPLFLLGFISVSVLNRPDLRYPIFLIVTVSSVLAAVLLRPRKHLTPKKASEHSLSTALKKSSAFPSSGKGENHSKTFTFSFLMLDSAIEQAFAVLTRVGGYIILFSVLASLLANLPLPAVILACVGSVLEITTGTSALSTLSLPNHLLISLVTGFVTFGGLSAAAQTKSVLAGTKFPFAHYLLTKVVAGLIAFGLMTLFLAVTS